MKNKKGAEMTIGTIIIIVLALIVLVILVYGFSTGWTNLWEKIINFGGGKINVQSVVQSCQLACTTGSRYDWCTVERDVVFEDKTKSGLYKCDTLASVSGVGLEDCAALKCENPVNCEVMDPVRNELKTRQDGFTRCPAGYSILNSVDSEPIAGAGGVLEKPAFCCQVKSTNAETQKAARLSDCKAIKTAAECDAAKCASTECTL